MTSYPTHNKQIIEEAAFWATCLEDAPLSPDQREKFATWLRASPKHIKELLLIQAISTDAEAIDADHSISIDELLENIDENVIELQSDKQVITPPLPFWKKLTPLQGIAASVAVIAFIAVSLTTTLFKSEDLIYATEKGEQSNFVLSDGSVIHLNTQSKVRIRYSTENRDIDLLEGEALFKVASNKNRPFNVYAGPTVTRAIGTSFNIYLKDNNTEVAVIEGKVLVSETSPLSEKNNVTLVGGEKTSINDIGEIQTAKISDVDSIAIWRKRTLVFENTPLTEIIQEFNRYNETQIRVNGISSPEPRFSGVFNVDKPDTFISTLKASGKAAITRDSDRIIIVHLSPQI